MLQGRNGSGLRRVEKTLTTEFSRLAGIGGAAAGTLASLGASWALAARPAAARVSAAMIRKMVMFFWREKWYRKYTRCGRGRLKGGLKKAGPLRAGLSLCEMRLTA